MNGIYKMAAEEFRRRMGLPDGSVLVRAETDASGEVRLHLGGLGGRSLGRRKPTSGEHVGFVVSGGAPHDYVMWVPEAEVVRTLDTRSLQWDEPT